MQVRNRQVLGLVEALRVTPTRRLWQGHEQETSFCRLDDLDAAHVIWALGVLGGSVCFEEEMETLVEVSQHASRPFQCTVVGGDNTAVTVTLSNTKSNLTSTTSRILCRGFGPAYVLYHLT